jgi:hypothetical protein
VTTYLNCIIISWTKYSFLSKHSVMSAPVIRARFLSPNWISELVWDSKSDEAEDPSDSRCKDEGRFEDKPGVSQLQPDHPTSGGQASSSSFK